ncbi:MAG TPA: site-specific DNA-methyltransferase [Bellilinea sp.]|nr:site-specific DNA-methyltransferase [Bellilinea sp.]
MHKVEFENCTLYLGDCRDILPMLTGVDVVVTDPPYGLDFPYNEYVDTRDNLKTLITEVMPVIGNVAKNAFVLCGPTQIGIYPEPDWVACITWNTTGTFGKYGYNQWTPLLCYGKDIKGFGNVNGVTKSDTIRINGGGGVGFMRDKAEKLHPCPKPISMMKQVIVRYTDEGATICDPFLGSGTTGVACLNLRRKFIGIEKDQKYFDLACHRIEQELRQGQLAL